MHDTAMRTGAAFFESYGKLFANPSILDVGSMDVNGTLRSVAPEGSSYTGIDLSSGPSVDRVVAAGETFPFADESFDLAVSTSCFEHDPMFWVTFVEMARVTRPGGFLYISAPSNGPYHGYPGDCWRFYADAAVALATWAKRNDQPIELIETFMMPPQNDIWIDNVMIFGKAPVPTDRGCVAPTCLA
jgi:SAM-dependent methyltransferase